MRAGRKIMVVLALLAALVAGGSAAAQAPGLPGGDQTYDGGGSPDGCNSAPVAVGDANYDGACDDPEALDVSAEYYSTVDGVASRCRMIEEKIKYRSAIAGNMIWEYVQQVQWCWAGGIIRSISRVRFPRSSTAGSIYWDFKGHIASSCTAYYDYSPCSELAGRPTAYIATMGKFQTVTCGVKLFCITKTPGMWVTITGYGKVAGFGKL